MIQLIEPLRDDVGKIADPKAPSLPETPVEVLTEVLVSIRDDYPLTGTYFVKEAQTYLDELGKTIQID